jgi:hypothetical protein
MRVMAKICMPTVPANRAISDGTIGKLMQGAADRWRPESMYFTTFDGQRTAYMVFDMPDASDMAVFAEPFFEGLEADVQLAPVMNAEDLQKGLSQLS